MAHHWMTNVSDDTEEVMQQRSNRGSESNAFYYRDKYNKQINAEADEGLARYNRAMQIDIKKQLQERRECESIVTRVLTVLEGMQFKTTKALNPRNTPLVQEIAKRIMNPEN